MRKGFFNARLIFLGKLKADIDFVAFGVLIIDFCFSQSRLTVKAPVHGFETAVDVALFHDFGESPDFSRFRCGPHREIRIFPVSQNAQALKARFLVLNLFGRVGAGFGDHFFLRQALAVLFLNLDFNRHAVAVPARDVGHIVAGKELRLIDDVLQNLI